MNSPFVVPLLLVSMAWWHGRRGRGAGVVLALLATLLAGSRASEKPWHEVGAHGAHGRYVDVCGGHNVYTTGAAQYRYVAPISEQTDVAVLAAATSGSVAEPGVAGTGQALFLGAVGGEVDHRFAGLSLGAQLGWLNSDNDFAALPGGEVRLGPRDFLYFEGRVFWGWPSDLPHPWLLGGIGVALPRIGDAWDRSRLLVLMGLAGPGLEAELSLPANLTLTPSIMYFRQDTWRVGLSVRLALGRTGQRDTEPVFGG